MPRLFFGYATGTNLMFPFAVGATVGLFSERPTAESLTAAIARYRATVVTNVPTMLGKLLELDDERRARGEPGLDLSSVRFHLSAGEALPEPLLRRLHERFPADVYDGIGSAEMFHIYCSNRPGDIKPGSLGRVVDGYELRDPSRGGRRRPARTPLPPGEIGVLWVKGDSVALGYFGDRDKSWKTFHGHWCRTGDLFAIDAEGYLYFSGRADDLFKVGGVLVAPREVEECLLAPPRRRRVVAVIPAEDEGLTKPKAFVEVRPDARARIATPPIGRRSPTSCKAHVKPSSSKHKYPRWVVFVDDLPKNDRGKVDKKTLIEREKRGELPSHDREVPRPTHHRVARDPRRRQARRDRARAGRLDRAARPAPPARHRRHHLGGRVPARVRAARQARHDGRRDRAGGQLRRHRVRDRILRRRLDPRARCSRVPRARSSMACSRAASATSASSTITSSPRTTPRSARCSKGAARRSLACPLAKKWARTLSDEFKSGECHAGRYETSIMMAAAPEFVTEALRTRLPVVPISLSDKLREGVTTFEEMGMQAAYAGDPASASIEEGEALIQKLGEMVVGEVLETLGVKAAS